MALGPGGAPFQFTLVVESRPEFVGQFAFYQLNICDSEIGFQDRGPCRALDLADLFAVLACLDKRFTDGFITVDDQLGELALCGPRFLRQQGLTPVEVPFVEVYHPAQADFKG